MTRITFSIGMVASMNARRAFALALLLPCVLLASVKPHFQLIGKRHRPTRADQVNVIGGITADLGAYETIGVMSDCSSLSTYAEFITVYRAEAAKYGANYIVVSKTRGTNATAMDGGLCVEATAIYVKPRPPKPPESPKEADEAQCVEYLKEIIRLRSVLDSLNLKIDSLTKE